MEFIEYPSFAVNLPQSMGQNAPNANGNPIQNMTAMSNPMGMNMNAHGSMLSTTTVMVSFNISQCGWIAFVSFYRLFIK